MHHSEEIGKNLGIKRRRDASDYLRYEELSKNDDKAGYRQMTQWLQVDHQLVVGRERVLRELLKICDRKGVAQRLKHRLERRRYVNKGPNCLWDIEGYEKLKPFGFCIHGCIYGFSRRIM